MMDYYRLPSISVLKVVCQTQEDKVTSSHRDPHVLHRLVRDKVIVFTIENIRKESDSAKQVSVLLEIEYKNEIEKHLVVFDCHELVQVGTETEGRTLRTVAAHGATDVKYGAFVGHSTQVVYCTSPEKCSMFIVHRNHLVRRPSHIKPEHEKMTFDLQSEEVQSALVGCGSSVFSSSSSSQGSALSNILLVGPTGSGLTTISQYLSSHFSTSLSIITYAPLVARGKEYADLTLHDILQCSLVQQPVVIVLDDLSAVAPREVKSDEQNQARVVQVILNLLAFSRHSSNTPTSSRHAPILSALKRQNAPRVLVVGVTSSLSSVDRRVVEMFQTQGTVIHVPLPTALNRREIVKKVYQRCLEGVSAEESQSVIDELELYALADGLLGQPTVCLVYSLTKSITTLLKDRRSSSASSSLNSSSRGQVTGLSRLSDVAGHDGIKQRLVEAIIWPRVHSSLFKQFGVSHSDCGVLLYGPPGTGKTLLPSVLGAAYNIHIVNMKISSIVQGEVGSSERAVVAAFNEAKRVAPCIVFIDEFQALFTARQSSSSGGEKDETGSLLSSTLAQCLDDVRQWNQANMESLVVVIGASNEPWAIDRGFLRSGRLSLALFVGPLDVQGRSEYLRGRWRQACERTVAITSAASAGGAEADVEKLVQEQELWFQWVATKCEGFTGADMSLLWQRAVRSLQEVGYTEGYTEVEDPSVTGVQLSEASAVESDDEAEEERADAELKELLKKIEALEGQYIKGLRSGSEQSSSAVAADPSTSKKTVEMDETTPETRSVYQCVPTWQHFSVALRSTKPSVSAQEIEEYLHWGKYERNH